MCCHYYYYYFTFCCLSALTVCLVLLQSEMHRSLSVNSPSMMQSCKIRMHIKRHQNTDGLAAHSAAFHHFHNMKMENPPREDAWYSSVCPWHWRESGMRFSIRSVGPQMAWPHAEPCFDLQQQGMEWSSLGPCPSEAPVDQSERLFSPETRLIYGSRVILCLRIKRQLNYGRSESWARMAGDGWGERTRTERQERWKDWDVWSVRLLRATSCSCKLFNMLMENRDGSAPRSQGRLYSLMLQKTRGQRWHAGLKSMIVGRCALQGSVQKSLWASLCILLLLSVFS